ncbi:MAG: sulfite exporter TauE/SafE family protein [Gemmatimonadaceae bacterium]
MTPLAVVLALLVGLTLGLLGGGGSILTVPVLVYALGVDPKAAVVMSLPIVGGAAIVGALQQWRLGHIELGRAVPFGVAAMAGAYSGARLARGLAGTTQLLILGVVMLAAAISMLRSAELVAPAEPAPRHASPKLLAVGALGGVLTGVVGVGGGFLIVPALVLLGGVSMTHAVGTSLLVIAMNTAAGYFGHHGSEVIPWELVLAFGAVVSIGIVVGGRLLRLVAQPKLKRAFAVLILVVAGLLIWQNQSLL